MKRKNFLENFEQRLDPNHVFRSRAVIVLRAGEGYLWTGQKGLAGKRGSIGIQEKKKMSYAGRDSRETWSTYTIHELKMTKKRKD